MKIFHIEKYYRLFLDYLTEHQKLELVMNIKKKITVLKNY